MLDQLWDKKRPSFNHSSLYRINYNEFVWVRGVQKTDEPNKPTETDRTVAKFSVWFRFGSVSVSFFKNRNFRCWIFSSETELNRPNIYIYIYIYIYLCNSVTCLISGLVVCYVVVLLVIPGSSLRVGACVFLLFNFLKP